MTAFRSFLALIFISLLAYTTLVGAMHGWGLLPIFFGDIAKLNWPGQFNYDFTLMLMLSALWTMWRNKFSGKGIALGGLALIGGSLFLSAYLLWLSIKNKGDIKAILLGAQASQV